MDAIAIGIGLWIGWRMFRKGYVRTAFPGGSVISPFQSLRQLLSEPAGALFQHIGYYPSGERVRLVQELAAAFSERDAAVAQAGDLARSLARAERRLLALERELGEGRSSGGYDPLFESVCLSSNAEPFLIDAAQKAFRKRYHPDTKPENEKVGAERKFKKYENIFDQIRARKGLR